MQDMIRVRGARANNLKNISIDIPRDKMTPLRRAGGRYLADKRKLQLPLKYFRLTEKDNLFTPVAKFLKEMHGEE